MIKPKNKTFFSTKNLTDDRFDTFYIKAFKMMNMKNTTVELFLFDTIFSPQIPRFVDKKNSTEYTFNNHLELFHEKKTEKKTNITRKTR